MNIQNYTKLTGEIFKMVIELTVDWYKNEVNVRMNVLTLIWQGV
jgi:ATP-dependent protease HslVU (ClpYQ) peptidase subunit